MRAKPNRFVILATILSCARESLVSSVFGQKLKPLLHDQIFFDKFHMSFLYVCMVNTIYLLSFVETPRKFIIAELSIRKLGSLSVLIISKALQ